MLLKEIAEEVLDLLKVKQKTLSIAESCTGGLLSSSITDIPGASKVYLGGVVVYATEMKKKILGLNEDVFKYGVISEEMAKEMAKAIKSLTGSDYSIATTGNLGPDTMEGKPKGLIYVAVATSSAVYVKELNLKGDRLYNKIEASREALKLLIKLIQEKE